MAGKTYEMMLKIAGKMDSSLKTACQNADKQLSALGKAGKTIGKVAVAGAALVTAGVAASVKTYADFEQAMANTAATASASSEEYAAMEAAAREAGRNTTKTATEAAEALGYMSLAGWDVNTSIAGLMPILRMAEATQMDLATCSDLVTDSMSALGIGVDGMTEYLDKAVMAQKASNTTAESLMEAFIGCGGAARAAGVDIDDLTTAAGILANAGLKGAEAGTALNSMIVRMTSKEAAMNALAAQGISVFDSQTGQFRGLETVMRDVAAATQSMNDEQKTAFLSAVAGTNYYSQFSTLLSAFEQNAEGTGDAWTELEAKISGSAGTMADVAAQNTDTLQGAWARFTSGIQEMMIAVGEETAPLLRDALQGMTDALPGIQETIMSIVPKIIEFGQALWDNRDKIITFGEAALAGFAAFKTVTTIGTAVSAIKGIGTAFKLASAGAKGFTAIKLGITALTGPFGLVALAIAGVVAAIVLLVKNKDKVVAFFTAIANAVYAAVDWIIGAVKSLGAKIAAAFSAIKAKVAAAMAAVLTKISVVLSAIKTAWSAAWNRIVSVCSSVFNRVKSVVTSVMSSVKAAISNGVNTVKSIWSTAWNGIVSTFSSVFNRVSAIAHNAMASVVSAVNTAISAINSLSGMSIPNITGRYSYQVDTSTGYRDVSYRHAAGGITKMPHVAWVGEGSENEAILPLSKLAAVMDSERQLGRAETAGGTGSVVFSPTINVYGSASQKDVEAATRVSFGEFKRMYEQMKREERRRAFSPA